MSKIQYLLKIKADSCFPALRDFPSDYIRVVGHNHRHTFVFRGVETRTNAEIGKIDLLETAHNLSTDQTLTRWGHIQANQTNFMRM